MALKNLRMTYLFLLIALPIALFPAVAPPPVPAPVQTFNPFKALSARSMIAGGSSITAGMLALGLRVWRKKLQKDLVKAHGMVQFAANNSLKKFLAEHQVASLEQDIINFKKYSQWLLAVAGVLGVGAIGSVSFDMGKALASPQPIIQERVVYAPQPPPRVVHVQVPQHDLLANELAQAGQDVAQSDRFYITPDMDSLEKAVRNYELAQHIFGQRDQWEDFNRERRAKDALEAELGIPLDGPARDQYIAARGDEYAGHIVRMNTVLNRIYEGEGEPLSTDSVTILAQLRQQTMTGAGACADQMPADEANLCAVLEKWRNDQQMRAYPEKARQEIQQAFERLSSPVQRAYRERVNQRLQASEHLNQQVDQLRRQLLGFKERIRAARENPAIAVEDFQRRLKKVYGALARLGEHVSDAEKTGIENSIKKALRMQVDVLKNMIQADDDDKDLGACYVRLQELYAVLTAYGTPVEADERAAIGALVEDQFEATLRSLQEEWTVERVGQHPTAAYAAIAQAQARLAGLPQNLRDQFVTWRNTSGVETKIAEHRDFKGKVQNIFGLMTDTGGRRWFTQEQLLEQRNDTEYWGAEARRLLQESEQLLTEIDASDLLAQSHQRVKEHLESVRHWFAEDGEESKSSD